MLPLNIVTSPAVCKSVIVPTLVILGWAVVINVPVTPLLTVIVSNVLLPFAVMLAYTLANLAFPGVPANTSESPTPIYDDLGI